MVTQSEWDQFFIVLYKLQGNPEANLLKEVYENAKIRNSTGIYDMLVNEFTKVQE